MTIEQEAREIADSVEKILNEACVTLGLADYDEMKSHILKALKAKQDRILHLEEKVREYKNEWESACERWRATNERVKELEQESKGRMDQIVYAKAELRRCYDKINELENELRAYDLDIYGADGAKEISNMRKRIETLESALRECNGWLKEVEESGIRYVCIGAKSQREKLEKALGGGANENQS